VYVCAYVYVCVCVYEVCTVCVEDLTIICKVAKFLNFPCEFLCIL